VPAARAADADCYIGFPFAFIKRKQVIQQLAETPHRLFNFRLRSEEPYHSRIVAGQPPEIRLKVRIGQMPDVKEEFEVCGTAVLVPKAQNLDPHRGPLFIETKTLHQVTAQRVHRVFGRIDDLVCQPPNATHGGPLAVNRPRQARPLRGVGSPEIRSANRFAFRSPQQSSSRPWERPRLLFVPRSRGRTSRRRHHDVRINATGPNTVWTQLR